MLKRLYRYRTNCCSNGDAADPVWQYSLAARVIACQFCGAVGRFATLPTEAPPPPLDTAHRGLRCWGAVSSAARVAFVPADRARGFLHFRIGDELHCGVVKSDGCVVSYSPKESRFRYDRAVGKIWDQAIICTLEGDNPANVEAWDRAVLESREEIGGTFDCLDFAVFVLNRVKIYEDCELTRGKLSEIMCRQLYHVIKYAEIQRSVAQPVENKVI